MASVCGVVMISSVSFHIRLMISCVSCSLQALSGVYAKDIHVRMACLNAVKCIPAVSRHSVPQSSEIATCIWLALHDPEKVLHILAKVPFLVIIALTLNFQFLKY